MRNKFSNKKILITGGSKGIGKAIAGELAKRGAELFLVARNHEHLVSARQELEDSYPGVKCRTSCADVSQPQQVDSAVRQMVAQLGGIDGVICNAGITYPEIFDAIPLGMFERVMQVDYLGSVYCVRACLPHLSRGSFVSLTSSVLGFVGAYGYSCYSGPKFALIGLAESLRQEFMEKGISVHVLCPPDTDTPGYVIENETKPYVTKELSKTTKILTPELVARRFVKALEKRKFFITVNFESEKVFRFQGFFPELTRTIIDSMIRGILKKKGKPNPG